MNVLLLGCRVARTGEGDRIDALVISAHAPAYQC